MISFPPYTEKAGSTVSSTMNKVGEKFVWRDEIQSANLWISMTPGKPKCAYIFTVTPARNKKPSKTSIQQVGMM